MSVSRRTILKSLGLVPFMTLPAFASEEEVEEKLPAKKLVRRKFSNAKELLDHISSKMDEIKERCIDKASCKQDFLGRFECAVDEFLFHLPVNALVQARMEALSPPLGYYLGLPTHRLTAKVWGFEDKSSFGYTTSEGFKGIRLVQVNLSFNVNYTFDYAFDGPMNFFLASMLPAGIPTAEAIKIASGYKKDRKDKIICHNLRANTGMQENPDFVNINSDHSWNSHFIG
jgi:hypothetical protein